MLLLLLCGCGTDHESLFAEAEQASLASPPVDLRCTPGEALNNQDVKLRLLVWNVHGAPFAQDIQSRLRAIAAEVLCRMPDVVLLQEVFSQRDAVELVSALGRDYQRIPRSEAVGQYKTVFGVYDLRRGGLFAFVRRGSEWLNDDLVSTFREFDAEAPVWRLWEGDGYADKGVQRILLESAGQPVALLNTHLQAQYGRRGYENVRSRQVDELTALSEGEEDGTIILAAGDFNTDARYNCPGEGQRDASAADPVFPRIVERWHVLIEPYYCAYHGTVVVGPTRKARWIDLVLSSRSAPPVTVAFFQLIENFKTDSPYSDHQGLELWLYW